MRLSGSPVGIISRPPYQGSESLPRADLISYWRASQYDSVLHELPDSAPAGKNRRTLYPLQFIDGAAVGTNTGILVTDTVVSHGGTGAAPTITAGTITFPAGTCFDLLLSNGSFYPGVVSDIGGGDFIIWDTVNGFHLLTATDCVGTSMLAGNDTLNQNGYELSVSGQYADDARTSAITVGTILPGGATVWTFTV